MKDVNSGFSSAVISKVVIYLYSQFIFLPSSILPCFDICIYICEFVLCFSFIVKKGKLRNLINSDIALRVELLKLVLF